MAEAVALLGALAAAAQLAVYSTKILSLISEMSSELKHGLKSVVNEIEHVQEFILIVEIILRDQNEVYAGAPLIKECLVDATKLFHILEAMSVSSGDNAVQRVVKFGKWRAKRKEIQQLCTNLERRKTLLTISGVYRILKLHETEQTVPQPSPVAPPVTARTVCGVSTIEIERTHPFIGREQLLSDLESRLVESNHHLRLALFGLGGIGKSELAVESAIRLLNKSPNKSLFWLHASSITSFERDYYKIATKCKVAGTATDAAVRPQATMDDITKWLSKEESGEWLMVVDDVGNSADEFLELLPRVPKGSIIFTTKSKAIAQKLAPPNNLIEVEPLDPLSAWELLKSRIGTCHSSELEWSREAKEILKLLDYLPLAISHMSAFIFANSLSISEYYRLYNGANEVSKLELLSNDDLFFQQPRFTLTHCAISGPVAHTLMISFERIQQYSPKAAELLCLMVCFDNSKIPRPLVLNLDMQGSDVQLVKALGVLKGYCLLTTGWDDSFSVHNLVYLTIRDWLRSRQQFRETSGKALRLVKNRFLFEKTDDIVACDPYITHAETVLKQLSIADCGDPATNAEAEDENIMNGADLSHRCSKYYRARGAYNQAERLARKAVEWSEKAKGLSQRRRWTIRSNLATALRYQGHLLEAKTIDEILVEERSKELGEKHPEALCSLNNFGLTLQELGSYPEAELIHRRVLITRVAILGREHIDTLSSISNLAMALQQQGQLQEAKELGEELVRLETKLLGAEHLDTLQSINNLGIVMQLQKNFAGAREKYLKVLDGREKLLGRRNPKTLMSLINIGRNLHEEGQFAAAEEAIREAFEGSMEALGTHHPQTMFAIKCLIVILQYLDRFLEAEEFCQQALKVEKEMLGEEHPDTKSTVQILERIIDGREQIGK